MSHLNKLTVFVSLLFIRCSQIPNEVRSALKVAGDNRPELEAVIDHYNNSRSDSLKLKAAYFLIQNLPDQFYYDGHSLDVYNTIISNMNDISVSELQKKWDSLQTIYGNDLIKKRDIDTLSANFLIDNIEMAFKSWELDWARNISFNDFCEYILPYKVSNEKPSYGWRSSIYEMNKMMIDSIKNKTNPLEASIYINNLLRKWCKISFEYQYPVDIDFEMASRVQIGTCDFACKMAMYPMRAMGVPVSFDYTPDWANRSFRHNWNAVIIDGKQKTFNGGETSVGSHKIQYIGVGRILCKPAKVFRKTFSIDKNSLPFLIEEEEIPSIFNNKRIKDVTSQYIPVSDVHVPIDKKTSKNHDIGYLCTFNNKNWVLSFWGELKKGEYVFRNMGRDIAYLPVTYNKYDNVPIADPFILTKDGSILICKPDYQRKQTIKIISKYPEDESNNIFPGENYELLFWDKKWVSAGTKIADTTFLIYDSLPSNALFWIRNHTKGVQERIFTYKNNKQIWW